MAFLDDVAVEAADPRRRCGFETWLSGIDKTLAAEIEQALEAGTYSRSAIYRTIRTPKYGFPGSLAMLQRHHIGLCACFMDSDA